MTRGTLELAFTITTNQKKVKTIDRWNRHYYKKCCNGSPGGDYRDGMHAMINVVDSTLVANVGLVRTCRSHNEKAFAW
jgi:hypothetical protein